MPRHAYLSASSSERWLACPPSASLCSQADDQGSPYAQQGTDAHALCEHLVNEALGRETADPTDGLATYDAEMRECAEAYRDFVMSQVEAARGLCPDPLLRLLVC